MKGKNVVLVDDVIATGNEGIFLVHERAFKERKRAVVKIQKAFKSLTRQELLTIEVPQARLSVEEAVRSYLFNSQIVTLPDGTMALVAPVESGEGRPREIIDGILKGDNPIQSVYFSDLRQSMANGGGPACLRLRVVLTGDELSQVHPGYVLDDKKFVLLEEWVKAHYRETLAVEELCRIELLEESREALDELTRILGLGKIYAFQ